NLGQTWGKMPRVKPPYPPKLHLETPYFLGFGLDKVAQDGGSGVRCPLFRTVMQEAANTIENNGI
ncbi:MAG: hypothetical protein RBS27_04230, partial [Giesbergeria sp.]|nr:hypothetical protein [Giesbergeria sp.]